MSQSESLINFCIARLHQHLQQERYCRSVARNYPNDARCFLRYLVRRGQALDAYRRPMSSTISMA